MKKADVVVVGAGAIGVACAYYLKRYSPKLSVALVDSHAPLALTSAHSGENYRNWWPHPTMKQFIDRSLDLVEEIERDVGDSMRQNSRGYLLCTASSHPDNVLTNLNVTFNDQLRFHDSVDTIDGGSDSGVDVLHGHENIRTLFPSLSSHARTLIHIRRGGALDTQRLAALMLERFKVAGGERIHGKVNSISTAAAFDTELESEGRLSTIRSSYVVNAAGPFAAEISQMLGVDLPIENVLQQKVSFEDVAGVIPRDLPFTIDLDDIALDWTAEEKALLAEEEEMQRFTEVMPGSIHCRPEGSGQWVKLGWAYNDSPDAAVRAPRLSDEFPEIVLRGASRLHPGLRRYIGAFPGGHVHYGGYYTMTNENWPLIGETGTPGYLMATALSGFGSMAACAAGDLVAGLIGNREMPEYTRDLSLQRYSNKKLMADIADLGDKGLL